MRLDTSNVITLTVSPPEE